MNEHSPKLVALGQSVRQRRKAKGLSQTRFAELVGMHRTYIADIERGARNLSIINLIRLAKALGISVSELCVEMR